MQKGVGGFREYHFQERCWSLLLSQFRLPNIQIPMIASFRVVVWEKGVLISVFASVLEMLLKLCKIHPADFLEWKINLDAIRVKYTWKLHFSLNIKLVIREVCI